MWQPISAEHDQMASRLVSLLWWPSLPRRPHCFVLISARQIFILSLLWNWAALCADLHYVGAIAIGQWMLAVIFLLAGAPGAWFLW